MQFIDKDAVEAAEDRWHDMAQAQQLRCSCCSLRIPYGDRQVYFDTGLCAYCAHQQANDD